MFAFSGFCGLVLVLLRCSLFYCWIVVCLWLLVLFCLLLFVAWFRFGIDCYNSIMRELILFLFNSIYY